MNQRVTGRILRSRKKEYLELELGNCVYYGEHEEGETVFLVENAQGEQLTVFCAHSGADQESASEAALDPESVPHLLQGMRVVGTDGVQFTCVKLPEGEPFEPIDRVLFGSGQCPMTIVQRFVLALSLAGAFRELEENRERLPIRQLRLDAILVGKRSCKVLIDCGKLEEEWTPQQRASYYKDLSETGCLPPEWYEQQDSDPASAAGLRHLLAVLLFRALTASDPFDGAQTLEQYPYKSTKALKKLYGFQAQYLLASDYGNSATSYIGYHARKTFAHLDEELKQPFVTAFTGGVQHPDQRPGARQWVENQKNMLNWLLLERKGWSVRNPRGTEGPQAMRCLCTEHGAVLPVAANKLLCRCSFEPLDAPLREQWIGVLRVEQQRTWIELVTGERVELEEGKECSVAGTRCTLRAQWSDASGTEG